MSIYLAGNIESENPSFSEFVKAVVNTREHLIARNQPSKVSKTWTWMTTDRSQYEKWLVQKATEGYCEIGSLNVVRRLQGAQEYKVLGIVKTVAPAKPIKNGWNFHAGALAFDDKNWFMSSPANYEHPSELKIVVDSNLRDVFSQFEELDGGVWPDPLFVEDAFHEGKFTKPRIEEVVTGKGFRCERLVYSEVLHRKGEDHILPRTFALTQV